MTDVLLAEFGGTVSRLALAGANGRPMRVTVIANDEVSGPEAAIARFLEQTASLPRAGVIAVAGPVNGDEITLTNRPWRFRLADLAARFGLTRIEAVNDFEALAWALPALGPSELRPLGPQMPIDKGVKVVLGPGTGLGVAALIPVERTWQAVASEGGHVSFGPAAHDEEPVFARLRADGVPVSAEAILCGPGLPRLHQAVNPGVMRISPEMIIRQARAGDREARATVSLFVRLLGRFASDVALTFKAQGGIYLAGGVALGLGPLLNEGLFRAAFEAHSQHRSLLAAIPTALIDCEEPGLIGCAAIAQRLMAKM